MLRLVLLLGAAMLVAGCGQADAPTTGEDGRVEATPRALAAVVIEHVDAGEPRRTTGRWGDWNDPPALEAQVDYGVDPEGTEDGEARTVRVDVREIAAFSRDDRAWFECRPEDEGRCEQEQVDGGTLLYRWWPGAEEEEPGSYSWTVVRDAEVVNVAYEGSELYDEDPRNLGLRVDPDDLRAAAIDPAMSLRTTPEAWQGGAELDNYDGVESAPEKPDVVPTSPRRLAARVADYTGIQPSSVRRSSRTDLGPDAVGAHLEFDGTKRYDPFTIDVLTAVGRAPQIDPLPCRVQRSEQAAQLSCFAWDADTAATWSLADAGGPGVLWIVGAHEDEQFNRVESVALRIVSTGLVKPLFTEAGHRGNRLPENLLGDVSPLTGDLGVGPETRVAE